MATNKRRTGPEIDAEGQLFESIDRLDETRITTLKVIAEEQQWKLAVMRAEMERLESILTPEHPRLIRMRSLMEHYGQSREAIEILVNAKDDGEEPIPEGNWELTGIVRYDKLGSPAGLKVALEPQGKALPALEAECNADGFYRMILEAERLRNYRDVPMLLKVYNKAKKPVFTAAEPIFLQPGQIQQDINI